jgi:hypothetical protein
METFVSEGSRFFRWVYIASGGGILPGDWQFSICCDM